MVFGVEIAFIAGFSISTSNKETSNFYTLFIQQESNKMPYNTISLSAEYKKYQNFLKNTYSTIEEYFKSINNQLNTHRVHERIDNTATEQLLELAREEVGRLKEIMSTSVIKNQIISCIEAIEKLTVQNETTRVHNTIKYITFSAILRETGIWTRKNSRLLFYPSGAKNDRKRTPIDFTYILGDCVMVKRGTSGYIENKGTKDEKFVEDTQYSTFKIGDAKYTTIEELYLIICEDKDLLDYFKSIYVKVTDAESCEKLMWKLSKLKVDLKAGDSDTNHHIREQKKHKRTILYKIFNTKGCITNLIKNNYDNFEEKMIRYKTRLEYLKEELRKCTYKGYIKLPFFN